MKMTRTQSCEKNRTALFKIKIGRNRAKKHDISQMNITVVGSRDAVDKNKQRRRNIAAFVTESMAATSEELWQSL